MRLLLDEMMPSELAPFLFGHEVRHVIDVGWRHVTNGELLKRCDANGIHVLLTKDGNLPYQQSLSGRKVAVLVLRTKAQSLPALLEIAPRVLEALKGLKPGTVEVVGSG